MRTNSQLLFFINMARAQAVMARRFDARLSQGIGLNDFAILYHLSLAPHEKMRRTELAEKVGLTASGVTRQLLPMEKIGLIQREADSHDARVSHVKLTGGGKRILGYAMDKAELLAEESLSKTKIKKLEELSEILTSLV